MAMAGSGVNEGVRALILETGCVEDSYRLDLRLLVVASIEANLCRKMLQLG